MEENTLLYYVLQVCPLWEMVRSCGLRTILVIFVPSVPTQHRTCLINIGSGLHTYCEAEHLFSAHRERIIWLGDGEGRSAKPVVTVSQQGQHTQSRPGCLGGCRPPSVERVSQSILISFGL